MSHPFGLLLAQYRARKDLTQAQLAAAAGYDPAVLARMAQGRKDLTGPSGRERVVRVLRALHDLGVWLTADEANALLAIAHLSPLYAPQPEEGALLQVLRPPEVAQPNAAAEPMPTVQLPPRHNLPVQVTPFFGREDEIADLVMRVQTARLLTLTGSGGCGKTRLALEVAARLKDADAFADGVWLIEFAPLSEPHLVVSAVTSALRLVEQPGKPPVETLLGALAPRHTLLLFDNCEHLIDACAELAESILHACPQVHLLVTSREALRISGEVDWRVPSLLSPDPQHLPPVEQLVDFPAVQLFVERGRTVRPGFGVTGDNTAAIARICHRLDGIPLALELAAGRLQGLTVHEIAARLDDRFRLLTGGSRTALRRHQTLRATLDWSYALLSEPERVLLARLSVFAGGWTAEAVEAVCADARDARSKTQETSDHALLPLASDILPLLLDLVRKSLVVAEQRGEQTRYTMLETIRQYAAERLDEERAPEIAGLRDRHMDYYVAQAEQADQLCETEEAFRLFGHLEADIDNCRAALVHSCSMPMEDNRGLRLAAALHLVWDRLNVHQEGREWLEELMPRAQAGTYVDANALRRASEMAWDDGDDAAARPLLEQCMRLCHEHGYYQVLPWALTCYAWVVRKEGGFAVALPYLEESLAISQEHSYLSGIGNALVALGYASYSQGELVKARSLDEAALKAFQEGDAPVGVAVSLLELALIEAAGGNYEAAVSQLARCIEILQRVKEWSHLAVSLKVLGQVLSEKGDYVQATIALEQSLATSRWFGRYLGNVGAAVEALLGLGMVAHAQGDFERANEMYTQVLTQSREAGHIALTARALYHMGINELVRHNLAPAAKCFGEAALLFAEIRRSWFALSLAGLAECTRQMGRARDATHICGCAVALMNSREESLRFVQFELPWPSDRQQYDHTVVAIRAQLGDPEIAAAWAKGQAMTLDQAVTCVRSDWQS